MSPVNRKNRALYAKTFSLTSGTRERQLGVRLESECVFIKCDKYNLDIFWLKDESIEDCQSSGSRFMAAEILEDLEAALAQFAETAADLNEPSENQ